VRFHEPLRGPGDVQLVGRYVVIAPPCPNGRISDGVNPRGPKPPLNIGSPPPAITG